MGRMGSRWVGSGYPSQIELQRRRVGSYNPTNMPRVMKYYYDDGQQDEDEEFGEWCELNYILPYPETYTLEQLEEADPSGEWQIYFHDEEEEEEEEE